MRISSLSTLVITILIVASCAAWSEDFTFIQATDVHAARSESRSTIASIANLSEISLPQYKVTAKAPSFVIVTGDMTQFGEPKAWTAYLDYWSGLNIPVYHCLGNHDSTWNSLRNEMRKLYGQPFYSFDSFGCHFVCLDSTIVQDPRPAFSEEELNWLKLDLAKLVPDTPVFIYFHHPPSGSEFASLYDRDRFLDIIRPYNIALIMVGHSHAIGAYNIDGSVDCVMGGSTFGESAGYNVVSVLDGVLRVAYKKADEPDAARGILEKPLPTHATYPLITINAPLESKIISGSSLNIKAGISGAQNLITDAWADLDDNRKIVLEKGSNGEYSGAAGLVALIPGTHYIRVNFKDAVGKVYHKSAVLQFEPVAAKAKCLWRVKLGGSSKSTPTAANGVVYVGADDGKLYALDALTGAQKWTFQTGGEVLSQPAVMGDFVIVGSGDGKVYGIGTSGQLHWSLNTSAPVYSSPAIKEGLVVIGNNAGQLYAIDPATGVEKWHNSSAKYTIESKPFISEDSVYYGAWDTFIYAVNAADGSLLWKTVAKGSIRDAAAKYYSPADCGPVVAGGKVFIPDRDYKLNIIDVKTPLVSQSMPNVAAVGLSEDSSSIYLRKTDGNLVKMALDGKEIWSVRCGMNVVPAVPVEKDGIVYICSAAGLATAIRANDGQILWQYMATPKLYVMSNVSAADGVAYVSGMDGSLTAIHAGKEQ